MSASLLVSGLAQGAAANAARPQRLAAHKVSDPRLLKIQIV